MKTIMILGAGILQLAAIEKATEMGLRVIAIDMDKDAVGMKVPGVIPEVISTIDTPAIITAAKKHKINGIMTIASDMPIRSVAAVASEMGLCGISEDTALKVTNKVMMRKALEQNAVAIPKFFSAKTIEEYNNAVLKFNSPFIVKPSDNSGSRGVVKISNINDKEQIKNAYEYSKKYSRNGEIVIEEYMEGPEVSVETLTVDGQCHIIQITDKITTGAPHFVEMGHTQPSRLPKTTLKEISALAKAANKAVGINNGPSHTEIIVTKEGPKIVELGARLGGDFISTHLVLLSTGVDLVESCIKIALGEKIDITIKKNCGSAIRYFEQKEGIIKSISGLKEAEKCDGVVQIGIVYSVGQKVSQIENSVSRMGYVIAEGKDAESAVSSCNEAMGKISVEIGE